MGTARSVARIEASPDTVWSLVADWPRVGDWFPGVAECEVNGEQRTLTLANGAKIVEDILVVDHDLRRLQYSVVDGDIRVDSHRATIDVLDVDGQAFVISAVDVEPEDRLKLFAGTLEPALDGLSRLAAEQ